MSVCRRVGAVVTFSTDWWACSGQSVYSRLAGYEDTNDAERLADDPTMRVILDMDSSESPVHGGQEGASYNGHFGSTCYHPLFVFNQFGDCEGTMLRAGNVHSAHRWRDVLDPILSRYGATGVRRYFRADAGFAKPDIYEYLEERRVFYAIRLPSNKVLQWEIAPLLIRPVGRPPKRPVILYTTTFGIVPGVGTALDGWWPRWSGIGESCSLGWASSSRT